MTSSMLSSRLLFAAVVLAVPFTNGGCGREACFTWTPIEGACPAQSEALTFFTNPACPGKITSVESEGTSELDGTLCCYQVTAREESEESNCQGFGGASSTGSVGEGFGGAAGFAVSGAGGTGGFGTSGPGGGAPCAHCMDLLQVTGMPTICDGSAVLFKLLFDCACSGSCSMDCGDNFCANGNVADACSVCLASGPGCSNQLAACAADQ